MICNWALREARKIGADTFKASLNWLNNFKKRNNISSRKITKIASTPEGHPSPVTMRKITNFKDQYKRWSSRFRRAAILNMDQTNFNYEQATERTLSLIVASVTLVSLLEVARNRPTPIQHSQ